MAIARIALSALALAFALHLPVSAQDFPARRITYIYPYAAGSSPDTVARMIGQEASRKIGQSIVHENRPGAGGRIGFEAVMRAPADGYTIGMFTNALGVYQPLIDQKLNVEPGKDYTALIQNYDTPQILVARPNAPFRDLKGLFAHAKANPGKLNASSPGPGTGGQLAIALIAQSAGVQITHVPYKGTGPAIAAVVAGEVDLTMTDSGAKPFVDAGKMIAIATGGEQRWSLFPDVPTFIENGGTKHAIWVGVIAPPSMPRDVLMKINKAYQDALYSPEVRGKLEGMGMIIRGGTPEEFAATIRAERELLAPVIRALNIRLE